MDDETASFGPVDDDDDDEEDDEWLLSDRCRRRLRRFRGGVEQGTHSLEEEEEEADVEMAAPVAMVVVESVRMEGISGDPSAGDNERRRGCFDGVPSVERMRVGDDACVSE